MGIHIDYVANGMGAQSMLLFHYACEGVIPATASFTADTGWEDDCDLNDGTKTTAREFFDKYIRPRAWRDGLAACFVRTLDKYDNDLPAIPDYLDQKLDVGKNRAVPVPMFGSNGGRLKQSCTDKWKVSAMKQQARRMGATTARSAQGIHWGERGRRVKGQYIGKESGFDIYQSTIMVKNEVKPIKWLTHYYPLVDFQMNREDCQIECNRLGIPYLISSECSGCPHADPWRWLRRSPETIEKVARIEDRYNGEFFFTDRRRPLREVIREFKKELAAQGGLFDDIADFGCADGVCGV